MDKNKWDCTYHPSFCDAQFKEDFPDPSATVYLSTNQNFGEEILWAAVNWSAGFEDKKRDAFYQLPVTLEEAVNKAAEWDWVIGPHWGIQN